MVRASVTKVICAVFSFLRLLYSSTDSKNFPSKYKLSFLGKHLKKQKRELRLVKCRKQFVLNVSIFYVKHK